MKQPPPLYLASVVVERTLHPGSLVTFFAQVAMIIPVALLGSWYLGLPRGERLVFGARSPRGLRRLAGLAG